MIVYHWQFSGFYYMYDIGESISRTQQDEKGEIRECHDGGEIFDDRYHPGNADTVEWSNPWYTTVQKEAVVFYGNEPSLTWAYVGVCNSSGPPAQPKKAYQWGRD